MLGTDSLVAGAETPDLSPVASLLATGERTFIVAQVLVVIFRNRWLEKLSLVDGDRKVMLEGGVGKVLGTRG